jgi:serine/threonine protein kinase
MIYEFVYGIPPFHADHEDEICTRALCARVEFPDSVTVSPEFVDLIQRLLVPDPTKRLGHGSIDEISGHPWFDGVDVAGEPPFVPQLESWDDTTYFEQRYAFDNDEDASILMDLHASPPDPEPESVPLAVSRYPSVGFKRLGEENRRLAKNAGIKVASSMVALPPVFDMMAGMRSADTDALATRRIRSIGRFNLQIEGMPRSPLDEE